MKGRRGFGLGGFGRWRSAFDFAVGVGRKCRNRAKTNKPSASSSNIVFSSLVCLIFAFVRLIFQALGLRKQPSKIPIYKHLLHHTLLMGNFVVVFNSILVGLPPFLSC